MKDRSFRTRKQPLCELEGGQLVRLHHGKQIANIREQKWQEAQSPYAQPAPNGV